MNKDSPRGESRWTPCAGTESFARARVVGGGKNVADSPIRTPPRKTRVRIQEHKHTSLISFIDESSRVRGFFKLDFTSQLLCPTLKRGQVVVIDNLSFHKGERVRQLIEAKGCELIYLPPYSPDYNPIEQAFSKLKSYLREVCARSQKTLMEIIGEALRTITVSDAEGFFKHCGYRAVVQSL